MGSKKLQLKDNLTMPIYLSMALTDLGQIVIWIPKIDRWAILQTQSSPVRCTKLMEMNYSWTD